MMTPTVAASRLRTRRRLGAALWLVQPLYLVVELVAASMSTAPYSLLHHTISDLGATTCTTIGYPSQDVAVCSPAHLAVNASFVLFGVAMAVGALLLRPWLPRSRWSTAAVVLWVVAGMSSIGSGLTPLDQLLELHAMVSTPGIVLSGVATALTGAALLRSWAQHWWWLVLVGAINALAGALMVVRLEVQWGGLIERIALWPSFVVCAVVAVAVLGRRSAGALPTA
ncbi:MAG TPA: DUF998 domain-containing protein [Candidatus Ruania gallistercoris]|uniref:DUF998 domain-containing protein n=1 Tax=Candidatus Ruania gallistercoris TaxID=2838746 RepID=A0A9D2EFN5_9MICO|nr:DUF998 domain-containing protein [Candidatus Ruania gallistercoris]